MLTNADKLYKKTLTEQQRRLKPSECQKYVRVVLDTSFCCSNFGKELIKEFKDADLNFKINSIGASCIYWERSAGQLEFVSNDDMAIFNDKWEVENHVIKVIKSSELKMHMDQNTLGEVGKELRAAFPNKRLSIIVPLIRNSIIDQSQVYVDFQLLEDIDVIEVIPNALQLFNVLIRFTKAIAEAPYKQQKSEGLGLFKTFMPDKKNCVRVDGKNGFGRLWRQHLTRLPRLTFGIADALISRYNCPKNLLNAYKDNPDAVEEIANIRPNYANVPISSQGARRIGNVLSSRLYTLYNSRCANECI